MMTKRSAFPQRHALQLEAALHVGGGDEIDAPHHGHQRAGVGVGQLTANDAHRERLVVEAPAGGQRAQQQGGKSLHQNRYPTPAQPPAKPNVCVTPSTTTATTMPCNPTDISQRGVK